MFDYCTGVKMSGNNWEGDKDLDSFKGQDWKGGVIDGHYDNRYEGVGNYGSGSSRNYGSGSSTPSSSSTSRRSRKIPVIISVILSVVVIGVFLFGDESFTPSDWTFPPLGDIIEPIRDIVEPIRGAIEPCEVYDEKETEQGKISLKLCPIKDKDVLTVSGDLSKSAQVNLALLSPDMKKIQDVTFVKKEFSHIIGQELYGKDAGQWRINIIIDGKLQGILKFCNISCD